MTERYVDKQGMKRLLILGVGGHGRVCGEIATLCGYVAEYLDDLPASNVLGSLDSYRNLRGSYENAFVALGNPDLREKWTERLKSENYNIPVLFHPSAHISKSAEIKEGSVVMAGAVVQPNSTVGEGSIISANSVVDHDATVGNYCHVNAGGVVAAGSVVPDKTKVDCCTVWSFK